MHASGRLIPLVLVSAAWVLLRSLNFASSVSTRGERVLGMLLVVLFAAFLVAETARAAGPRLRSRLASRDGRVRFILLAFGYVVAHAVLASMVTRTDAGHHAAHAAPTVATGFAYGPLTVWPHVEAAWPALGVAGYATLGHAILLPAIGVVFAAAVTVVGDAWRARAACRGAGATAVGAAGAPALVTTACPTCGPAILGLLAFVGAGTGPLTAWLGNPASPQAALVEVAGPVIAVAALARFAAPHAEPTRRRAWWSPRVVSVTAVAFLLLGAPLAQALGGFPRGASTRQNALYDFFVLVTTAGVLLTAIVIALTVYVALRYRVRVDEDHGIVDERPISRRARPWVQTAYILVPALVIFGLGVVSYGLFLEFEEPPAGTTYVDVVGQQFVWAFTYPDGKQSVNTLRVQANEVVVLNVTSRDVMHNVFIPDLGVKMHANPSYTTQTWFQATVPGTYRMWCAEFCGPGHAEMLAEVTVFPEGSQDKPYGEA